MTELNVEETDVVDRLLQIIADDVAPSFYPALSSFLAVVEPVWAGEATSSGAVLVA